MLELGKWKYVRGSELTIPHVPPPKRHPYDQWSPDARALDLVGDKWTLLIVRDLISGPRRFVELQRVLPGISTEQLRSRLNRMVADGMLTRKRYREVPPRVDYELTERARELAPVLGRAGPLGLRVGVGSARVRPRHRHRRDLPPDPGLHRPDGDHRGHGRADRRATVATASPPSTWCTCAGPARRSPRATTAAPTRASRGTSDAWIAALAPRGERPGCRPPATSGSPRRCWTLLSLGQDRAAVAAVTAEAGRLAARRRSRRPASPAAGPPPRRRDPARPPRRATATARLLVRVVRRR